MPPEFTANDAFDSPWTRRGLPDALCRRGDRCRPVAISPNSILPMTRLVVRVRCDQPLGHHLQRCAHSSDRRHRARRVYGILIGGPLGTLLALSMSLRRCDGCSIRCDDHLRDSKLGLISMFILILGENTKPHVALIVVSIMSSTSTADDKQSMRSIRTRYLQCA